MKSLTRNLLFILVFSFFAACEPEPLPENNDLEDFSDVMDRGDEEVPIDSKKNRD